MSISSNVSLHNLSLIKANSSGHPTTLKCHKICRLFLSNVCLWLKYVILLRKQPNIVFSHPDIM